MKALIIAAGETETKYKFPVDYKPKCLLKHKGEVLLERMVKIFKELGVNDITVVTGYRHKDIEEFVDRKNLHINLCYSSRWTPFGAVTSLMAGLEYTGLEEDTIIIFSDLYVKKSTIEELIKCSSDICLFSMRSVNEFLMCKISSGKLKIEEIEMGIWRNLLKDGSNWHKGFPLHFGFPWYLIEQKAFVKDISKEIIEIDYYHQVSDNKVGYAFVVGDLFHIGHLKFLKACKEYCDHLVVGVYTDELTKSYKREPIIPFEERKEILESIKYIDEIIEVKQLDCTPVLKRLKERGYNIKYLFHGDNWKEVKGRDYIVEIGGKLIQPPYYKDQSTTKIIKEIRKRKESDLKI